MERTAEIEMPAGMGNSPPGLAAKAALSSSFKKRGIAVAIMSGASYGMYTAFITLAMTMGVWSVWYGDNSGLSDFSKLFLLGALGAAITDTCSALWAVLITIYKGKLSDFFRCIATKPGAILVGAAVIGGPLASTSYVLGLQSAGSIIVPISALCPAIGTILSRIMFKQQLTRRILLGIFICFVASAMIGSTGLAADAPPNLFLGLMFGFLAAFGWGLEGCVGGYATSMIDPEIGITIRQMTSGLSNLIILVPLFAFFGGADTLTMLGTAFTDSVAMPWFLVAGFCAYFAFMLWYKGNAMCGTALGMSCNGAFSFWGPFFSWIVLGLAFNIPGYALSPIAWLAAVVMVIGIFIIAVNPLALFSKKGDAA
ncbi:MAG: hypothetical protein HY916_10480 [Desulfovibrio sp.]|jgi:drug/metabolite transporter (DMT)-like permease|nr:hypothetical protein [Desulfovibrio sp.]